jgi:signal transduction histidine kinase
VIGSIANQTEASAVLREVARQAAQVIGADGVGIFLLDGDALVLRTAYELGAEPDSVRLLRGHGMAWQAVSARQMVQVEDYRRDWKGVPDLPLANDVFGAVMCTPLIAGGDPLGAMMAVAAKQGRMFDREDAYLLQLLSAQAAVAVTQGNLFHEQAALTGAVEQSRNQLQTVLASTDSPVIAMDRNFSVIFANPAARVLFGEAAGQAKTSLAELLPASAFPANLRAALRELRRSRTLTYEAEVGDQIFLAHVARLGDARIEGWVAVLNDITQLKELDRLKSEMVRMTSHDLKNPLQAAMANLELLRDDVYAEGTPDVRDSVDAIDRQLLRMNRIIRGILDLERVKNGVIALELCRPERIIKDAAQEMAEFAREHEVMLSWYAAPDLPPVACDIEQLGRAIINLVENAIKFTPAGGRVSMAAQAHGASVDFVVSDTGVGIAPELQERVFDRFFRAKQKGVEHVSGSGLGLSLVKTIVSNHRGTIWLESEEHAGTTFTIRLPAAQDTGL